jgi:carbonic anhydrase/acetyltransferase-like protein (isoleucine patch superfamily)
MNNKPLILLGSNSVLYKQIEVCEDNGIEIAGIIDSDYFGNTERLCDLPIIDTEKSFNDPVKLNFYKQNFNFFCATNWVPFKDPVSIRNKEKRKNLIDMIDLLELDCINLIDKFARVSKYAKLGKGCFIDGNAMIEPGCIIHDFVNIYANCEVGDNANIGRNSVMQRGAGVGGGVTLENEVYFSAEVHAPKNNITFSQGTFIHEFVYIRRGTVPNEIVEQFSANQKRVYHPFYIEDNYE